MDLIIHMVKSKFKVFYFKVHKIYSRHKIYEFISGLAFILSFHFQTVLYILVDGLRLERQVRLSNTRTKNGNFLEILSAHDGIIVQSKWDQPSTFLAEKTFLTLRILKIFQ